MSELKGALMSMSILFLFVFPALLFLGIGSLQQHAFIKTTTSFKELVKEEGGITNRVENAVNNLEDRGYDIKFKNPDGSNYVFGSEGNTIVIDYNYIYPNVKGENSLHSENIVFINSR